MTVTEPDVDAIKQRIALILQNNTTELWTQNHEIGFQKIEVGLPDNNVFTGLAYPVCYITNDEELEEDKPEGPTSNGRDVSRSWHLFKFKIILFDKQDDGQAVEKSLDDLTKAVKQTLKENIKLVHPTNLNDDLAVESHPIKTRSFAAQLSGEPLDGRIITLKVVVFK